MPTRFLAITRHLTLVAAVTAATVAPVTLARQAAPPPPGQNPGQNNGGNDAGAGRGQDGGRRGGGQGQDGAGGGRRGGGFNFGGGGGGGRGGFGGGGGGMRDVREALDPDFVRRDVPVFIQQLKLDDTQVPVLETLMHDYEEDYKVSAEVIQTEVQDLGRNVFQSIITPEMRDRFFGEMQKMQEEIAKAAADRGGELDDETRRAMFRDRMTKIQEEMAQERKASGADKELKKTLSDMFDKLNAWQTKKAEMRKAFVEGLKATLSDDQLASWPAFERFLNREKTLSRGRLSGESTNLIFVVDELKMPEGEFAKVEPLLDPYELALDAALVARNDFLVSSMPRLFKAMENGDAKEAERIFERQMQLRTVVRDVNEDYRQQMVTALGETDASKSFEKAALLDGYERIYRATTAQRSFEAALEMEGIDPEVRKSIADLQTAYLNELSGKNRDLLSVTKRNEPTQQAEDAGRFATFMAAAMSGDFSALGGMGMPFGRGQFNDRPEDPVRNAMETRNDLGQSYIDRLKALLTPEQIEQLPRREGRGGGGPGGQNGPGGQGMTRMLEALPEAQRTEIMAKVDTNKNGQIDDDERGEFFRAMRDAGVDVFGRGGGGGGGTPGGDGPRRRDRQAE